MLIRIPFSTFERYMEEEETFYIDREELAENIWADMQQWAVDEEHEDSYRRAVERGRRNDN